MVESLNQFSAENRKAKQDAVRVKYESLSYYTIEDIGEGLHNTISNFPANKSLSEAVLSEDELGISQIKSEHKLIKQGGRDIAEGYMFRAQNSNGQVIILSPGMLGDFSDTFIKTHLGQIVTLGYDVFILNHSGLKKNQKTVRYITNQNYASNQTYEVGHGSSTGSHLSTISAWRRDVPSAIKALAKDYKQIKLITHSTGGGLVSAMFANYFDKTKDGTTVEPWSLKSQEINKITAWVNLAGATYGSSTMKMPHQYRDEYFTGETKTTAELWEYAINYLFAAESDLTEQHHTMLSESRNTSNSILSRLKKLKVDNFKDIIPTLRQVIIKLFNRDKSTSVGAIFRLKELESMFSKINSLATNAAAQDALSGIKVTSLVANHDEYLTAENFQDQDETNSFKYFSETTLESWGAGNIVKIPDLPPLTIAQRQKLVDLGFIFNVKGVLMNHDMHTLQTEQILEALQV